MKTISTNLYVRGAIGSIYLRRRIPKALKSLYPKGKTHKIVCLHTSDVGVAKKRQNLEEVRIDAEFSQRLQELKKIQNDRTVTRLEKMSDEQLKSLADYWVRQVLLTDEHHRSFASEDEFDEKGNQMSCRCSARLCLDEMTLLGVYQVGDQVQY